MRFNFHSLLSAVRPAPVRRGVRAQRDEHVVRPLHAETPRVDQEHPEPRGARCSLWLTVTLNGTAVFVVTQHSISL